MNNKFDMSKSNIVIINSSLASLSKACTLASLCKSLPVCGFCAESTDAKKLSISAADQCNILVFGRCALFFFVGVWPICYAGLDS